MKVIVSGYCGHLGREVARLTKEGYRGSEFFCGMDIGCKEDDGECVRSWENLPEGGECIVDFSHHSATEKLLEYAVKNGIPTVIATTGQTDEEKDIIKKASEKIPVFFAANYSIGVALMANLVKIAVAAMPDAEVEIIEMHHDRKVDAPSGTALTLAAAVKEVRPEAQVVSGRSGYGKRTPEEIGVHSIRMGNIVGVHEVLIGTQNETLSIKHDISDRSMFAEGALAAAEFLASKEPGLYDMKSLFKI